MRVELVMAAKRHGMPTVAVVVATPLNVCLERQGPRPDNRRVPETVVRAQHQAMTYSHQQLAAEGFNTIVFAGSLHRLEPFLARLSAVREADPGRDGSEGLGDLLLVRRFFGAEILPLWTWRPGSDLVTGRDRVADIRLGEQRLTLAFRADADAEPCTEWAQPGKWHLVLEDVQKLALPIPARGQRSCPGSRRRT